jgi:hypothetical protein
MCKLFPVCLGHPAYVRTLTFTLPKGCASRGGQGALYNDLTRSPHERYQKSQRRALSALPAQILANSEYGRSVSEGWGVSYVHFNTAGTLMLQRRRPIQEFSDIIYAFKGGESRYRALMVKYALDSGLWTLDYLHRVLTSVARS